MWVETSVRRLSNRLIEPPEAVQGQEQRSQARLLAATASIVALFYAVLALASLLTHNPRGGILLLSAAGSIAIYGLSRAGHDEIGRVVLPVVTLAAALGTVLIDPEPEMLAFMIVPGVIAGFLWPSRALIGLCGVEIVSVLLLRPLTQAPDAELLTLVFVMVIVLIQITASVLNSRTKLELAQRTVELAASNARLRALLKNSPDAYYLLQAAKDEAGVVVDFEILDVNPVGLAYAQQAREMLVGSRVNTQTRSYLIDDAFERCLKVIESGQAFTDTVKVDMPDGTRRWFSVAGVPVTSDRLAIVSRDMTQQKLAEETLRESEARFRNMADSAPVLMWVSELDKQITYFNRAWLTFTGRSLEEETGYGWAQVVHPEDREACVRTYDESFDARQPYQMTYRLRRHDGEYRWMLEVGVPRYTDERVFLGYMGSAIDITDQKQTEAALRASQAYLRATVESLPFEFWAQDKDERYVLQNSYSVALWGSAIDHKIDESDLPEAIREEWERNNRRAKAGDVVRKEMIYDRDTGPHYTYNIVVPVRDGDDILGIAGVNIDITETKQLEARLRALLEAIPDFMARISRAGIYLEVVHGTDFQSFSLSDQAVGRSLYDLLPPDLADLRMAYIQRALESGLLQTYEYTMDIAGERRQVEVRVAPSGPDEVVVIMRDVTARKEAEARALDLALERERMALLRRFVGDRTHDLMTPLTILKTSLYLLTRVDSPQRRAEHIDKLNGEVDHLESMIRNMLMILRLDRPVEDEFEFALQDLDALVDHVVAAHQPVAISRQQILEYAGSPSLPLVSFDREKLEQALANLIDNALKYTNAGGHVVVAISQVNDEACIAVRDNGRGIASADLPRIFDRFFRADSALNHASGSGLGLAIVDKITRAHGGRVEAKSRQGSGSVFRIVLPLTTDQTRMAQPDD